MAQMNSIIVISTNENSLQEGEGGGRERRRTLEVKRYKVTDLGWLDAEKV